MTDAKRRPSATIYAVVVQDQVADQGRSEARREIWIPIGVLWRTKEGNLSGELQAFPFSWHNAESSRKIIIQIRKDETK